MYVCAHEINLIIHMCVCVSGCTTHFLFFVKIPIPGVFRLCYDGTGGDGEEDDEEDDDDGEDEGTGEGEDEDEGEDDEEEDAEP